MRLSLRAAEGNEPSTFKGQKFSLQKVKFVFMNIVLLHYSWHPASSPPTLQHAIDVSFHAA